MIGNTLRKYLLINYLKTSILVTLIISIFCVLIDFTQTSAHLSTIVHYKSIFPLIISTLRLPFLLLQVLPSVILLTGVICLYIHNKRYELVILRSIGLSAWQFIYPVILAALLIGIFAILIIDPISAYSLRKSEELLAKWQGTSYSSNLRNTPWLIQKTEDGETEIRAQYLLNNLTPSEVSKIINNLPNYIDTTKIKESITDNNKYIEFNNTSFLYIPKTTTEMPLIQWIQAKKAILLPNYWLLIDANIYQASTDPKNLPAYLIKTNIKPQFLETYLTDPYTVPFYLLKEKIDIANNFGSEPYSYETLLNYLVALPFLLITMVLIAASFSLNFTRFGNIKILALASILSGFMLYVTNSLAQNLAKAGLISPIIAAWIPVSIALFFGVYSILRNEDG